MSRTLYLLPILAVVLVGLTATSGLHYRFVATESTSPLNAGIYGTSIFVRLLASRGYTVVLAQPSELETLKGHIVYVVIGPDKPFTRDEIDALKRLAEEGRLSLLVGDELGIANGLTGELLGVKVAGSQLRVEENLGTGWDDFVPARCLNDTILFSKPSALMGGEPLCRALGTPWLDADGDRHVEVGEARLPGAVLAAYVERGGVQGIVVADSSIFANYMVKGYRGLPPTAQIVEAFADMLARNHSNTVFAVDYTHYEYEEKSMLKPIVAAVVLPRLLLTAAWHAASSAHREWVLVIVAVSAGLLSLFAAPPPARLRRRERMDGSLLGYLASEALALARASGDEKLRKLVARLAADPGVAGKLIEEMLDHLEGRRVGGG